MVDHRVALVTLGCKVNQYETNSIRELFRQDNYTIVPFSEEADVYVINTCAVTAQAVRKSRQLIRQAHRHNEDALIVVMGCFPQIAEEDVEKLEGVDIIVGSTNKGQVVHLVNDALQRKSGIEPISIVTSFTPDIEFEDLVEATQSGRVRAELKIQDGCQQFCSYCIIPYARGPERSCSLGSIVKHANMLVLKGYREIVLTGIHLGAYGRDFATELELADVLRALLNETEIERIRLSSVEPTDISMGLLDVMSSSHRVARHLHIPLQSGCDRTLAAMHRKYTTADYHQTVKRVRSTVSGVAVTTDLIVGFPGETEEDFIDTYNFVKTIAFSRMHIFRYSRRSGTPAASMPEQVSGSAKTKRSSMMHELAHDLSKKYHASMIGKRFNVLLEREIAPGVWEGHTDTYVKTHVHHNNLNKNMFVDVTIPEAHSDYVVGV